MSVVMSCHQSKRILIDWLIDWLIESKVDALTLCIIRTGVMVWPVTHRHSSQRYHQYNLYSNSNNIYGSIRLLFKQHEYLSSTQVRNGQGSNVTYFIDFTSIETNTVMYFMDHGSNARRFNTDIFHRHFPIRHNIYPEKSWVESAS